VPGIQAHRVELEIVQKELGVLALNGSSTFSTKGGGGTGRTELALGVSPSVTEPKNAQVNAALQGTPGMAEKVSIVPEPVTTATGRKELITTAEALEAVHNATGQDVIGDHFTRVHPRAAATVKEAPLFDALCRVSDALRQRWGREDGWLTFRSVSFFNDRPKEVPRRLFLYWQQARRTAGGLPLDDLLRIATLSDAQLDSTDLAQGAEHLYGIAEWEQVRNSQLRPHWRILAALPGDGRGAALSAQGLPFGDMPWEVQERVTAHVVPISSKPARFAEVYAGLLLRARFVPAVEAEKKRMMAEFTYSYPSPGGTRYRQQVGTDGGVSYGPEPPPVAAK
jgi:hypothetical protein